eukprot:1941031-Amphidinium_carterae.1
MCLLFVVVVGRIPRSVQQDNSHNLSSEDLEVWKAFEESAKALERERASLEKICRELEKGGKQEMGQQTQVHPTLETLSDQEDCK